MDIVLVALVAKDTHDDETKDPHDLDLRHMPCPMKTNVQRMVVGVDIAEGNFYGDTTG